MSGVRNDRLVIRKATENNLKGIDVEFDLNKLTVVTGPSGSGKSSLVYDTVYAESFRCFAQGFDVDVAGLRHLPKPHVDSIENLRPTLCVSQLSHNRNPRSTVGTVTDASCFLRGIFAAVYYLERGTIVPDDQFSTNSPNGCCLSCRGLGFENTIDEAKVVPCRSKSLSEGALEVFNTGKMQLESALLHAFCVANGISESSAFDKLPQRHQLRLLYEEGAESYRVSYRTYNGKKRSKSHAFVGAVRYLQRLLPDIDRPSVAQRLQKFIGSVPCHACKGTGLGPVGASFTVCGMTIHAVESAEIPDVDRWAHAVGDKYGKSCFSLAELCENLVTRLATLSSLRLSYLSLNRSVPTLSGGELQRVRMACQMCCPLSGLIYVLDEPCRGLHHLDMPSIIRSSRSLVEKGNAVIAIEHNHQFIRSADNLVILGPKGGPEGGHLLKNKKRACPIDLVTCFEHERTQCLIPDERLRKEVDCVVLSGIRYNNLDLQRLVIPMGGIVGLTGVSGSGKTSLRVVVEQSLSKNIPWNCKKFSNHSEVFHVEAIDQSAIGRTPRSIVASYLSVYDDIREYFARHAVPNGVKITASDFSVNIPGGRCEQCHGTGRVGLDIPFVPDASIVCTECGGRRFRKEILDCKCNGLSINNVLDESVEVILPLFRDSKVIVEKLQLLIDLGIGYLKLGQPTCRLSGGEAQRLKIAKVLCASQHRSQLFLLDEPSSGLSISDCELLARVLFRVVKMGHSLLLIEHNFDFLQVMTDFVIDLGRIPGRLGGKQVFEGRIRELESMKDSSWYGYHRK